MERLEGRRLLSGQGNLEAVLPAESQGTDTTVAAGQYQSGFEYWVLVKRPEQRVLA